mgnify:CR=1 FL=1
MKDANSRQHGVDNRSFAMDLSWLPLSRSVRQSILDRLYDRLGREYCSDISDLDVEGTDHCIDPYEWIVNLVFVLRESLELEEVLQLARSIDKISKIFMKFTRPIGRDRAIMYLPDDDMNKFHQSDYDRELVRELVPNSSWRHFMDYVRAALATPGYDPNPIISGAGNLMQLNKSMAKFFRNRVKQAKVEGEIRTVFMLSNGFHLAQLLDELAYKFEGKRMDNCVGDYWIPHASSDNDMRIWSVRDQDNKPYATLELHGQTVVQLEGPDNGPVTNQAVRDALINFFKIDLSSGKSHSIYRVHMDCISNLI